MKTSSCSILIVVGLVARISSTAFYTKYNMSYGDEKMLWWMPPTTLIITSGFVGQLFGALITPSLLNFFDKRKLMIFTNLLFAASIFATYFVPTDQFMPTLILYAMGIFPLESSLPSFFRCTPTVRADFLFFEKKYHLKIKCLYFNWLLFQEKI